MVATVQLESAESEGAGIRHPSRMKQQKMLTRVRAEGCMWCSVGYARDIVKQV